MTRLVSERAAAGATANDTSVRTASVAANRVDLERRMTPTSGWSFMAGVGKVHRGRLGRVASARGGGTGAAEPRLGGLSRGWEWAAADARKTSGRPPHPL